jgi:hypothetical protein
MNTLSTALLQAPFTIRCHVAFTCLLCPYNWLRRRLRRRSEEGRAAISKRPDAALVRGQVLRKEQKNSIDWFDYKQEGCLSLSSPSSHDCHSNTAQRKDKTAPAGVWRSHANTQSLSCKKSAFERSSIVRATMVVIQLDGVSTGTSTRKQETCTNQNDALLVI